jgi:hypothetical protein
VEKKLKKTDSDYFKACGVTWLVVIIQLIWANVGSSSSHQMSYGSDIREGSRPPAIRRTSIVKTRYYRR